MVAHLSVEEPPAGEAPPALLAAAEAFESWEGLLADSLRAHGVAADRVEGLAALVVASVEGATAMCRARRTAQALDQVAEQLEALITAALGRPA
ncbi:hypothetical protein [Streptomyces sp. NPDC046862]|uniref:LmrA/YxaF family transcription factor n=1 Tax=Streptomyces sp. NPDC046862 TaxID=3154603 RepID=UPI003452BDF3